jgi:hypothetical protein
MTVDPNGLPPPYEIVFDPHIAVALSLLAIVLVILLLMIAVPIPDERQPKRPRRPPGQAP